MAIVTAESPQQLNYGWNHKPMSWRKKNMMKLKIMEEAAKEEEREHNALSHS